MITNFKIYELNFHKVNEDHKTININKLIKDCSDLNVDQLDLIKEVILNKKILFYCHYCYNNHGLLNDNGHFIFDICKDVKYEDSDYLYQNLLVKIKNDPNVWHTLFTITEDNKRVRIYDYEEGPLMKELEILKNIKTFNL